MRGRSEAAEAPFCDLTVYYIVGLPRSGSSFVGDWIARRTRAVNVGESWQTFRTAGVVCDEVHSRGSGRWTAGRERDQKLKRIMSSTFWREVLQEQNDAPYTRLLRSARRSSNTIVDSSKVDHGLRAYLALGCGIRVIHTVRGFSTWSHSFNKYRDRDALPPISPLRLAYSYIQLNRQYAGWRQHVLYQVFRHEYLADIDAHFIGLAAQNAAGRHVREEMFGAPDFRPRFDSARASVGKPTLADELLYRVSGVA